MTFLHEIVDPYNYTDTRGKPIVTQIATIKNSGAHYTSFVIYDGTGERQFITGLSDGTIQILKLSGELIKTLRKGEGKYVYKLLTVGRRYLISVFNVAGTRKTPIEVWDLEGGTLLHVLEGHTDLVYSVCAIDEERLASASQDRSLRIWSAKSGECLKVLKGHTGGVTCVCLVGNNYLASGSRDQTVRIWNIESGECVQDLMQPFQAITSICAITDNLIAVAQGMRAGEFTKGVIYIIDINTGYIMLSLWGHKELIHTILYIGSGRSGRLVSVSQNPNYFSEHTIRVWDIFNRNIDNINLLKIKYKEFPYEIHSSLGKSGTDFFSIDRTGISIWDITDVDNFPKTVRSSFGQIKNAFRRIFSRSKTANVAPNPLGVSTGSIPQEGPPLSLPPPPPPRRTAPPPPPYPRRTAPPPPPYPRRTAPPPPPLSPTASITQTPLPGSMETSSPKGGRRSRKNRSVKGKSRKFKNKKRR
jgi:WD40 repeat protein